jgi:hypothetical protein
MIVPVKQHVQGYVVDELAMFPTRSPYRPVPRQAGAMDRQLSANCRVFPILMVDSEGLIGDGVSVRKAGTSLRRTSPNRAIRSRDNAHNCRVIDVVGFGDVALAPLDNLPD